MSHKKLIINTLPKTQCTTIKSNALRYLKCTTISQTTCCHYTNNTKIQQPIHPAQPDTKQHLAPSSPRLLTHSFIHSSTRPLTSSSTHPLIHSSSHPLVRSSTHPADSPPSSPSPLLLRRQLSFPMSLITLQLSIITSSIARQFSIPPLPSHNRSPTPTSTFLLHRQLSSPTSPIALQLPIFTSHCASILLFPYSYRVSTRTSRTSRKMLQKLHQTTHCQKHF